MISDRSFGQAQLSSTAASWRGSAGVSVVHCCSAAHRWTAAVGRLSSVVIHCSPTSHGCVDSCTATAASVSRGGETKMGIARTRAQWEFQASCCATTSCPGARFSGIHGLRSPRRLVDRCAQLRSRPPSHLPSSTLLRRQLRLRRSAAQPVPQSATALPYLPTAALVT